MLIVLRNSWALLLGILLLLLGNGMQGTLLGIRGGIEGFSTSQMSYVMAGYSLGFLFGSRMAPKMIRRVGHVRVFAALGSMISAVLILYPTAPDWVAWTAMRVIIGFSFAGVYIAAESWLNNASTNETRGQALSLYMIMQMIGIISAQVLVNFGDPSGYILFVIPSVLVSLAFTPILLSARPAPAFETTQRLSFAALYRISPLGCVGMFVLGGIFSAQFSMASVWGTSAGLSVRDISVFIAAIYAGGLLLQYPVGWASDRFGRRSLVAWLSAFAGVALFAPLFVPINFTTLLVIALVMGGVSNPLYSLLVAYTNDFLGPSDMPAASAGLMFINGLGAIGGPLAVAAVMELMGPVGYFIFQAVLFLALAGYTVWRITRRQVSDRSGFTHTSPSITILGVEAAVGAAEDDAAAKQPGADAEVDPDADAPSPGASPGR